MSATSKSSESRQQVGAGQHSGLVYDVNVYRGTSLEQSHQPIMIVNYGLQSLSKVQPTACHVPPPTNLPSLKAEVGSSLTDNKQDGSQSGAQTQQGAAAGTAQSQTEWNTAHNRFQTDFPALSAAEDSRTDGQFSLRDQSSCFLDRECDSERNFGNSHRPSESDCERRTFEQAASASETVRPATKDSEPHADGQSETRKNKSEGAQPSRKVDADGERPLPPANSDAECKRNCEAVGTSASETVSRATGTEAVVRSRSGDAEADASKQLRFGASDIKFLRTILRRPQLNTKKGMNCKNGNGSSKMVDEKLNASTKRRKPDSTPNEQSPAAPTHCFSIRNGPTLSRSTSTASTSSNEPRLQIGVLSTRFCTLDYIRKLNDSLEVEMHAAANWLRRFDEIHGGVGNRYGAQFDAACRLKPRPVSVATNQSGPLGAIRNDTGATKRPASSCVSASACVARWNAEVCRVKRTVKVQVQRARTECWTPQEQAIIRVLLRRKPIPNSRRFQEALGGSRTEAEIERFISLLLATETRL